MRWIYAVKNGWLNRQQLKTFLHDPAKRVNSLQEITFEKLEEANVAILALDFDGVLAAHDAKEPLPEVMIWLTKLSQTLGEQRIAILTNKPKRERIAFFTKHFPSMHVVQDVRKKPYPDGLLEIANYKGVAPHRVLLVDDRLLTGMLATCMAYTQGWYFSRPYRDFKRHFFKELFFSMLRVTERFLLK